MNAAQQMRSDADDVRGAIPWFHEVTTSFELMALAIYIAQCWLLGQTATPPTVVFRVSAEWAIGLKTLRATDTANDQVV
jgi:hypothetical protein